MRYFSYCPAPANYNDCGILCCILYKSHIKKDKDQNMSFDTHIIENKNMYVENNLADDPEDDIYKNIRGNLN